MSVSRILTEDFEYIYKHNDFSKIMNSSFFITGATGLIGSQLIQFLDYLNTQYNYNITIYCLIRNIEKAKTVFKDIESKNYLKFITGDVKNLPSINEKIDYVIHGATTTASRDFVEKAVEVIDVAVNGTLNVLNFCKAKQVKSIVYLSSMEVYGITLDKPIFEDDLGYIDIKNPRSSYSEGKRICECLCTAYASEYGLNVKSARLAQTFGAGISYSDTRIPAYFARSVIEGTDIVLKTEGKTARPILYTRDAISGLLIILLNGEKGESYTVANKSSYTSIRKTAEMIASVISKNKIEVKIEAVNASIYAPDVTLNLQTDKLEKLGWTPSVGLEEAYNRMIEDMKLRN